MLSYMACAIPVVATPVSVNAEILQRDEVGVAAQTADQWFDALTRLHSDHELGARMGQAGRKLVSANYSVAANVPLLADIFQEVVAAQGGGKSGKRSTKSHEATRKMNKR
jgi:glycosyltransferase involved in cell wall biosynthesis